ncbi:hypothetical protein M3I54_41135 [Paraburkholderia sp. CNPSo 3274]|uniref:hypothetical protein n=1 Tax=Paraburkholderia sp. CNPSo 3274 TaxID=2940932 RepID=UPI0020B6DAB9|nr:hypothetical protein [Paraburkholderia sp. CNPSo 3274]MCP3713198.1 hypothetical protein [Paraburkholderia sp. CNPSo 3274]
MSVFDIGGPAPDPQPARRDRSGAVPAAALWLAKQGAGVELVALALPAGCAPETLPPAVAALMAACWPGMSRAQLLDRARRLALRASLRARPGSSSEPGPDGVRLYALVLMMGEVRAELVAHVRRLARRRGARRARASLPPARDMRQAGLF